MDAIALLSVERKDSTLIAPLSRLYRIASLTRTLARESGAVKRDRAASRCLDLRATRTILRQRTATAFLALLIVLGSLTVVATSGRAEGGSIPLTTGWNLIAWTGPTENVGQALSSGGVASDVDVVWGFDTSSQRWKAYFPSAAGIRGANDLTRLVSSNGYFVHSDADVAWPVRGDNSTPTADRTSSALPTGTGVTINGSGSPTIPTALDVSSATVAENQPVGTAVGTLTAAAASPGTTFVFSLVGGEGSANNGAFTISGTTLETNAVFDYETQASYSVRIRVTDGAGGIFEKAFTIAVTDVNEAPTNISLSNASIAENLPAGSTVGTLSGTDPDSADTLTFSLVPGAADDASFQLDGATLESAESFDYETKASYSINIRATDTGGKTFDKPFTITVSDVDETPPVVDPTAVADSATVARYSTSNTITVLDNDTNPSGDPVTITAVTQPAHGTVSIADDVQSVNYVPATDYCNSDASGDLAADTFTYTVNGGSTATVSVTVVAPDNAPTVTALTRQRGMATPNAITDYDAAASNALADGAKLIVSATETADPAACGTDTLSYQWTISYPGFDDFRDAGITGSHTPNLSIALNALLPYQQLPGAQISIAATSSVSGKTTTVTFFSFVSQSTLSVAVYNYCQAHPTGDPGCSIAVAGPSTEP